MKLKSFTGVFSLLIFFAILEMAAALNWIDVRFFPRPSRALSRLAELLFENGVTLAGSFDQHLASSAAKLAAALALAALFSLVVTLAAGLNSYARHAMSAMIGIIYPLPKSAVFPFFLLVFGVSGGAQIFLSFLGASALMLATTFAGLNRLEAAGYMEIARILKLDRGVIVRKFLLPGLLPEFMHGFKLGASYAIVLLIVSEMIATKLGVGVVLWSAWDQFKILDLYAMLYLISGFGFLIYGLFDAFGEKFSDSQRAV